jgi:ABC-type lipoprotein export system ATPase subunit
VAIARALVHEPRLLVCDEPTAALDHETGQTVMELLRSAAVRPERAAIVVTHASRICPFGERIAHMDDGRIVHDPSMNLARFTAVFANSNANRRVDRDETVEWAGPSGPTG